MDHDNDIASLRTSTLNELNESLFEEPMRQAIETSQVDFAQAGPVFTSPSTSTFLSERAQLEKERRERQERHRKAQGFPLSDDERKEYDEEVEAGELPSVSDSRIDSGTTTTTSSSQKDTFFWNGERRPTATSGVEPRKDERLTFNLSEVLGDKDDIAFAILSTFALNPSWIYGLFNPSVPVIMVTQPDSTGSASVKNVFPNWIKTTPSIQGGYDIVVHIFYKTGRLRVVVSTANLTPYDWEVIENAVWLQDIPPRSNDDVLKQPDEESFECLMRRVLDNVNVESALSVMREQDQRNLPIGNTGDICTKWDWSNVAVKLVPSIAGKHEEWPSVILTGHTRLMKAVRDMGFRTGRWSREQNLDLEYQGSSIGSYTTQWVNEFYHSAKGESAEDWLDKPKRIRERLLYPTGLKVLYPTLETVRGSQYGERGGQELFCNRSKWESPNFPRHLFYDSQSKAGRTLLHTKMIVSIVSSGRSTEFKHEDGKFKATNTDVGWAYLGSHNFTPSAWGMLSGSAFRPIMTINNYELGIVFPLKSMAEADQVACFERPPRKYGPNDTPCIQDESIYFKPSSP
ncbi:tyrosyl-DNA phosphodiesterase-domain-containing protein [Lentinula raphanica]|nr:tyrosyl-DNA phosphodiesterase-domain-containing protein [Lentinula raphanica]